MAWLFVTPARAEWLRAESPNFIVFSQATEARLRQQVDELEDYDQLLRMLTGIRTPPSPNKLHVYLVRGAPQLAQIRPGVGNLTAGFYAARPTGIAIVADEQAIFDENPSRRRMQVLFHEYAHHFMQQYFPAAYPSWYVEGFAEYMMNTRINGGVMEYGSYARERALMLTTSNSWLNMDRLLFNPTNLSGEESLKFYAQSWITVHYLLSDPQRRTALSNYLTAYGRGEPPREAFQAAFGKSVGDLTDELRRYVRRGIQVHRLTRHSGSTPTPITVARLPRSATRLLLLEAGLRLGVHGNAAQSYLERIRRIAADDPDDRYALRVLARAEAFHGDGAAAERILGRLLQEAPNDAELLYLSGMRHLVAVRRGDTGTHARPAQRFFVRAHRADANHVPTLFAYAESLRGEPNFVSENTSNILILAHQLAPQVDDIRVQAAVMLMNRDQYDQAEALLVPMAASLHSSRHGAAVRELLARARARQRPGVLREGTEDEAAEGGASGEPQSPTPRR